MSKRAFLQLAHVYKPDKHTPTNWFLSEKLDGHRFFWDGGLSRGCLATDVPWANTEKDDRLLSRPIATGLWSRSGKVIHAPDWWIRALPTFPLDGELWMGRGLHQALGSCIKKHSPTLEWEHVKAMVFTSPPLDVVFSVGEIRELNFKKDITPEAIDWCRDRGWRDGPRWKFSEGYSWLERNLAESKYVNLLPQERVLIPGHKFVEEKLAKLVDAGAEGLMLQHPDAYWAPQRSHMLLKVKPFEDDEATVVGYTWGRETDKESKHLGRMGALVVSYNGKIFELSGFTDQERELIAGPGADDREPHISAGKRVSANYRSYEFPLGSRVTFRYRDFTDDLIPKEARYYRKRASDE